MTTRGIFVKITFAADQKNNFRKLNFFVESHLIRLNFIRVLKQQKRLYIYQLINKKSIEKLGHRSSRKMALTFLTWTLNLSTY